MVGLVIMNRQVTFYHWVRDLKVLGVIGCVRGCISGCYRMY